MTRVKVCGVTRPDDRDAAVAAGADAIGVISGVTVDTPREVDAETARELADGVPPLVTGVLVTMPRSVQTAVRRVERVGADAVQIHGGLDAGEVAALGRRVDVPVLAAVDPGSPEADESDASRVAAMADAADALLVDTPGEDGGGGTGETHDWSRTRDIVDELDVPVLLAGGLDPENVAAAIERVGPYGVDVASGVERSGGVKDHDAVSALVARANDADAAERDHRRSDDEGAVA